MIRTIVLYGNPGAFSVTDGDLFNREIIAVHREGVLYNPIDGYTYSGASVTFINAFAGPTIGRVPRFALERVFIIYR
jgi:hypothetical protein